MKRKPTSRDLHLSLIERAYLAFAHVTRPINMEYSAYKDSVQIERLVSTPKRDISEDDIGYYAGSALTTVGNGENYRFFLPRILESIINDVRWPPANVTVDRLEMAGWTSWSAEERNIVLEVAELAAVRDDVRFAEEREQFPWQPDDRKAPESWVFQLRRLRAMPMPAPTSTKPRKPPRHHKWVGRQHDQHDGELDD
jgi:hypothetical protein